MNTYWISFAGNMGNLGCCITDAESDMGALEKTNVLGINPGGEALICKIPADCEDVGIFEKDRLITPEKLMAHKYKKLDDLNDKELGRLSRFPGITQVCEDCNTKKK